MNFLKLVGLLLIFHVFCVAHEGDSVKKIESFHSHKDLTGHTHIGWESRYFSEGRDALEGSSIWTGSIELGYDHLSGGVWYGRSSNHRYDELQYSLNLSEETGHFSFYAGYTHLVFAKDDDSDDEWSLGVAYDGLPYSLGTSLDGTYSMDAKGMFYEWSTYREFSLAEQSTGLISGILGMNDGYVSDGHNGANFYAFSFGLEREITEELLVFGHGMQSFAIDSNPAFAGDDQLKDFFHFGIGLQWSF